MDTREATASLFLFKWAERGGPPNRAGAGGRQAG